MLQNLLTYSRWGMEGMFPQLHIPAAAAASIFVCALGLLLFFGTIGKSWPRPSARQPTGAFALAPWLIGAMGLVLFMPNHAYRYYLSVAAPALFGLTVLSMRICFDRAGAPPWTSAIALAALTTFSVLSSFTHFRTIDLRRLGQPYLEGTNDLVRRGATVDAVEAGLLTAHPSLPAHSVLLFNGLEIWSFGKDAGPRVWYRDPTIQAYGAADLVVESGRWFLRDPVESQAERYTGATRQLVGLEGRPVFLFDLVGERLIERQMSPDAP